MKSRGVSFFFLPAILVVLILEGFGSPPKEKYTEKNRFDLAKNRKRFPYDQLRLFRISDSLKRTARLEGKDFYDVFQFLTTPPHGPGECGCGRMKQLYPGQDFLLNYVGRRAVMPESRDSVDLITVLSVYRDTARIYLVSFMAKDPTDTFFLMPKKGVLSHPYLPIELARKWQSDTASFELYSEWLATDTYRMTSVTKSPAGSCIDSTVEILQTGFYNDLPGVIIDGTSWKKGKLYYDWMNTEEGEAWWRNPALKK